jgi:hypothetical protein
MQSLTRQLTNLLGCKQQFKIKFRQYDRGVHIFYPNYSNCTEIVTHGDIVAWMMDGGALKFGCVASVLVDNVLVTYLSRAKSKRVHTSFSKKQIVCIFQQDT